MSNSKQRFSAYSYSKRRQTAGSLEIDTNAPPVFTTSKKNLQTILTATNIVASPIKYGTDSQQQSLMSRLHSPDSTHRRLPTVSAHGSQSMRPQSSMMKNEYHFGFGTHSPTNTLSSENLDKIKKQFYKSEIMILDSGLLKSPQQYSFVSPRSSTNIASPQNRAHTSHIKERMPLLLQKRQDIKQFTSKREKISSIADTLRALFEDNLKKIMVDLPSAMEKEYSPLHTSIEIEFLVYRIIKNLSEELSTKESALEEALSKLRKAEEQLEVLNRQLIGKSLLDETYERTRIQLEIQSEQQQKNEVALSLERAKLEQEKTMLASKLGTLKHQEQLNNSLILENQNYKKAAEEKMKKYEKIIESLHMKLTKFDMKNNSLNVKVEQLMKENDELNTKLGEKGEISFTLHEELAVLKEQVDMYRERALMQKEDYAGLLTQFIDFQDNVDQMTEKILAKQDSKNLKERKITSKPKTQDEVQRDFLLMKHITDYYLKPSHKLEDEHLILSAFDHEHHNIKDFFYKKAPFDALYEDLEIFIKRDVKVRFDVEFLATIRAIFDSKYNEFLLNPDDWKSFSHFPDFAHAWLGKFCVDQVSRQVRTLKLGDLDVESIRRTFKENLNHKMTYKLWDAITFRECLAENLSKDELLFYLHARFLLFHGPQLRAQGASFEYIHYVLFSKIEELVKHILHGFFDEETIRLVKEKLREKSKIKNNRVLIDSAFCLRILLESYRKVKEMKFGMIRKIVDTQPNISTEPGVFSISFRSFHLVLQGMCSNVTELEATELYRFAWRVGKGKVDAVSVLIALNESGFLIKDLKLKGWVHFPNLSEGQKFDTTNPEGAVCQFICDKYLSLHSTVESINYVVGGLGIESVLNQIYELERFIQNKFQMDESVLNGKTLVSMLLCFYSTALRVNHLEIYLRSNQSKGKDVQFLENQVATMEKTLKEAVNFKNEDALKDIEKMSWTRRLQNFFRRKASSWYKLMAYLLENRIKKRLIFIESGAASPTKIKSESSSPSSRTMKKSGKLNLAMKRMSSFGTPKTNPSAGTPKNYLSVGTPKSAFKTKFG